MWTFIGPVFRSVSIPPAIDIQYFLQSEASPEYCGTCLLRKEAVRLSIVPPSPPPHTHARSPCSEKSVRYKPLPATSGSPMRSKSAVGENRDTPRHIRGIERTATELRFDSNFRKSLVRRNSKLFSLHCRTLWSNLVGLKMLGLGLGFQVRIQTLP